MIRNYLKGVVGDEINLIMAAAAFNFKRLLRKIEHEFIFLLNLCNQFFYISIPRNFASQC